MFPNASGAPVGITLNADWPEPMRSSATDSSACARYLDFTLGWFAHPIFRTGDYPPSMRYRVGEGRLPTFTPSESELLLGSADFLGLNWYSTQTVAELTARNAARTLPTLWRMATKSGGGSGSALPLLQGLVRGTPSYFSDLGVVVGDGRREWPRTDMGWAVTPWAFARMLAHVHNTYRPKGGIHVTENGVAIEGEEDACRASADGRRTAFLRAHLASLHWAMTRAGVDVRAYHVWSLMDNFEWAHGYTKRFGLYHVDFATRCRRAKPAVAFYRSVASTGTVVDDEEGGTDPFCAAAVRARLPGWP